METTLTLHRVTIKALSAAFFAAGYNNESCASLPVPPPSAIQGLVAAAVGDPQLQNFIAGWHFRFTSIYKDYEQIVPARRYVKETASETDVEPWRDGYRVKRTPVFRSYLIEPRLSLYLHSDLAKAFRAPFYTLRLGRSQDLAWVSAIDEVQVYLVDEAEIEGVVVPFPPPQGCGVTMLWGVPATGSGYGERQWQNPTPYVFVRDRSRCSGLKERRFYLDSQQNCAFPLHQL